MAAVYIAFATEMLKLYYVLTVHWPLSHVTLYSKQDNLQIGTHVVVLFPVQGLFP